MADGVESVLIPQCHVVYPHPFHVVKGWLVSAPGVGWGRSSESPSTSIRWAGRDLSHVWYIHTYIIYYMWFVFCFFFRARYNSVGTRNGLILRSLNECASFGNGNGVDGVDGTPPSPQLLCNRIQQPTSVLLFIQSCALQSDWFTDAGPVLFIERLTIDLWLLQ